MLKIENAEGTVLAFLNNLTEAKVKEVLNGEYTLSFVATIDHLKTDFLYDENNLINYENDLFRPVTIEELHDEDDALTVAVECEHISYDLIKNVMSDFNYTYTSAASVMTQCLIGTDFNLRSCNITEKTDIQYTEECNSKQISIAIANNWQGELKYYRNYIDLVKSRGQDRGTGFIFGKNLKSVKRIINRAEGTTSYEVDIVEGTETEELGYYELGDIVRVVDKRLNVDYSCKIIEIEKDILTGLNSTVVLGDAIKDMRSSFSSIKKDVQEVKDTIISGSVNWNKVSEIVNSSGEIVLGKLNTLTNIATKIVNSTGTFEHLDNCLYWHDQPTEEASTFATKWGAQGLVFANSKDADGNWIWQTALDANGLIATSLTSSCLNTITAHILNLVVDNLVGKIITGVTIKGSEFISDDSNSTSSMRLTNGTLSFINPYGESFIHYNGISLHGPNSSSVQIIPDDDSYGRVSQKIIVQGQNDFQLIQGNCQANVMLTTDGGVYLNAGYGDNGDIWLQPKTSSNFVYVMGALDTFGDKNAAVPTQHYGVRALYCEEADRCYFSTKGIAETVYGECIIELDPMFLETIELNHTCPYLIQLTPYSNANMYVDAVEDGKFIVKSNIDTKFAYDLKAIRISYEKVYLEERKVANSILKKVQEAAIDRMS